MNPKDQNVGCHLCHRDGHVITSKTPLALPASSMGRYLGKGTRYSGLDYASAERHLHTVFHRVRDRHGPAGESYITAHWTRYVNILTLLPPLTGNSRVLEIGASILSSAIRAVAGSEVHAIHHELEPQWPGLYEGEGIRTWPVELVRDPLPVPQGYFDRILLSEVIEHLPVDPEFLIRQIINRLAPQGQLLLTTPNAASSAKRLKLFAGKNPQDRLDRRFIYYSHHHEMVMRECCDLVRECGGAVVEKRWTDFSFAAPIYKRAWFCLRQLRHGNIHPLIHAVMPSTRDFLFLRVRRDTHPSSEMESTPPLRGSGEFGAKPAGI